MRRTLRAFAHVVRADVLERVRRHGFLVTLAGTLWFAYVFLPPSDAHYVTFQVAQHRGRYGSAWVGAAVAMLAAAFLSLIGFYLVKNAIARDRATGVGQILATTPLSKPLYTLGKAASNFVVLATFTALLAAGALAMQLLRGEDMRVDLVALLAPFVVVTLPALVVVSGLAVLFEAIAWLRGGLGNAVYFFLWGGLLVATQPHHRDLFSGIGDFLGTSALMPSILHDVAAAFPAVDPATASYSFGFNFSRAATAHLRTFDWAGPHWTAGVLAGRLVWTALGLGLALVAAIPFDRFDQAVAMAPGRRPRRGANAAAVTVAAVTAVAPTRTPAHVTAATLPAPRRAASALPLLWGELRLMTGGLPWPWWVVAAGLAIACWIAPLGVARGILLPLAWIWPLLCWSPMGARESLHRTEALVFVAPRALTRSLVATWLAGLLVACAMGLGIGVRLLAAGDGAGAAAWLGGVAFIPTLALACGAWTGDGRLFEVAYLLLWYAGPMNHAAPLDFAGATPAALAAGAPARFAIVTAVLAVAAVLGRARRLRG